ncbi:MAG: Mur ligase family protein, partial [Bacteroidales bacterium]|nr:Mur ligase family protein [Bacteroidales bacterium]
FVERHKAYLDEYRPSFFEITTAMAFDYFAGQKVDMAVIETGLGGRLDATNVIEPVLSIITNIGMDHCEYLGNTLASIAAEKAGIIKAHTPVVIGERDPQTDSVFLQKAEDLAAPIFFAQDGFKVQESIQEDDCQRFIVIEEGGEPQEYCSDLRGWYQQKNLPAVLMAAKLLKINSKAIHEGIRNAAQTTRLRGRWESISQKPEVIVDAAHNAHGMKCAVAQLHKRDYRRLHFILGVVVEKDLDSILALLPQDALYYFTQAQIPRALDAHILADFCRKAGLHGQVVERVQEAIAVAKTRAHPQDLVFVGGSIFVAAEALGGG